MMPAGPQIPCGPAKIIFSAKKIIVRFVQNIDEKPVAIFAILTYTESTKARLRPGRFFAVSHENPQN